MAKIRFNPIGGLDCNEEIHYTAEEFSQLPREAINVPNYKEIINARLHPRKEYNRRREEGEAYFLSEEYLQSDGLITELYPELFMSFEEYKKSNR